MKKLILLLCGVCLALSACSSPAAKAFDPKATADALLASQAFSETLEALDADLLYDKLDAATLKDSAVYASTGATAEEIAVLTLTDEEAAKAAKAVLQGRVDDQTAVLKDYQPNELAKLEKAVLEQRGNTVLLVVASNYDEVTRALSALS